MDKKTKNIDIKTFILTIVATVIAGVILGGGSMFLGLSNKVTRLEIEIEHLKNTGNTERSISTDSHANQKKEEEVSKIRKPLAKLNMNKAQDIESIQLFARFQIEWDKGPASKVFQVYKDTNIVYKDRIRNGALVSLDVSIRGQCEFKTWWDDGTERREEVWVYVVND